VMHLAGGQQRKGHLLLVAESADSFKRIQLAPGVVELLQERSSQVATARRYTRAFSIATCKLQFVGRQDPEVRVLERPARANLRPGAGPFGAEIRIPGIISSSKHGPVRARSGGYSFLDPMTNGSATLRGISGRSRPLRFSLM